MSLLWLKPQVTHWTAAERSSLLYPVFTTICVQIICACIYPGWTRAWWTTVKLKGSLPVSDVHPFISHHYMHACMHIVEHSYIQYVIKKTLTRTQCRYKNTHESCGVRIYCILSVLVQEGLCAAAAVGLTSQQPTAGLQYHCYSSSIHNLMGQSLHKLFNYDTPFPAANPLYTTCSASNSRQTLLD